MKRCHVNVTALLHIIAVKSKMLLSLCLFSSGFFGCRCLFGYGSGLGCRCFCLGGRGLAAAALSRHDQVMRKLGAEIMTGGGNPFYKKIGYQKEKKLLHMKKDNE